MGKAMGGGLKEVGSELGSLLPGLIGQIVSFLFKTAGADGRLSDQAHLTPDFGGGCFHF